MTLDVPPGKFATPAGSFPPHLTERTMTDETTADDRSGQELGPLGHRPSVIAGKASACRKCLNGGEESPTTAAVGPLPAEFGDAPEGEGRGRRQRGPGA